MNRRIMGALRSPVAREEGFAGGWEVLPFGFLVFVAGSLLLVNGWTVIDAKLAVTSAAREGARAFVESPGPEARAWDDAHRAARDALAGHGREPARLELAADGGAVFERCRPVTIVARYEVPTLRVPWVGAFGGSLITVEARHREVVDPYRHGLPVTGEVPCE